MVSENDQSKRNTPLLIVLNAVETKKGRKERGGREENRTKGGKKGRRERKKLYKDKQKLYFSGKTK